MKKKNATALMRPLWSALLLSLSLLTGMGNAVAAETAATTILILGDSLSSAYGIRQEESWPALLQKRLAEAAIPAVVVNGSRKGETTAGGLRRLPGLLAATQPTVVIIELGANDGLRRRALTDIEADLQGLLYLVRRQRATPLVAGVRLPPALPADYASGFKAVFDRRALEHGASYVPSLLARVMKDPRYFLPDRLHPNAEAQPLILDTLWPTLVQAIERARVRLGN